MADQGTCGSACSDARSTCRSSGASCKDDATLTACAAAPATGATKALQPVLCVETVTPCCSASPRKSCAAGDGGVAACVGADSRCPAQSGGCVVGGGHSRGGPAAVLAIALALLALTRARRRRA